MSLHSHVFVVIPAVLLAAAGCKSKDKAPAGDPAGTAAATAAARTDAATVTAMGADAASAAGQGGDAGAPMTAGGLMGPFASLDAYCKAERARFVKDDCFSMSDQMEMCACDIATGQDVAGPISAKGKDGHITDAIIVTLADKAADYAHCSIGLRVGDGWHVAPKAFPCGAAPVSHDGGIDVTVTSFTITTSGGTDKVALAFTSDDGQKKTKHALDCTAAAPNAASCAPVRTVK